MIISKIDNRNKIIYKSNNLTDLFRKLEELTFVFLNTLEVQPEEKLLKKSKSGKCGWYPYGYCAISTYDKITIYKKELIKGILYNNDNIRKIINFQIIRPEERLHPDIEKDYDEINTFVNYKINKWEHIHDDIKKKDIIDIDNSK